jgi:hypothetical protein
MSDITSPPPSGNESGNAPITPTQTEVPINPNQTTPPNPLGPQAPQAPVGDLEGSKHRPPSRREAIKAAYDKAVRQQEAAERGAKARSEPAEAPKAKTAEAKPGHNKPPEETEKLDLKKRPADQPRGERGQFAPRSQTPPGEAEGSVPAKGTIGTQAEGSIRTLPENAPHRDPPARMAEHGKRDWAATPESVRGEVHRMHQEFGNAYNQLKPVYDAFQPIARFHDMATQHGTTLERALTNYTGIEQKLRQDVVGGLDVIVNNLGLKTPDGQPIGLRDIAYHVLSQTPEQLRQIQQGNTQTAAGQQIGALYQKIDTLENAMRQMHTAQQFTYTRSQVDQFADSHPRFDELGATIHAELQAGYDLESAYRRAELLQPATHAPQTRTPAAQTRAPADRSISGSPSVSGSNPALRKNEKPVGRREAIQRAIAHVNGRL